MIRAILCGRSAVESPLAAIVPYNFQMRAGLATPVSTCTAASLKRLASALSARSTSPPSSDGRSMR